MQGIDAEKIDKENAVTPKGKASQKKSLGSASGSRFMQRRDSDDQLERAVGHKLDHVPKSIQLSKVNSNGNNILDEALEAIKSKRPANGKLGSRW